MQKHNLPQYVKCESHVCECAYLTTHSMLHLLGYDHLDEGPQKAQMRKREEEIAALIPRMNR